MNSGPTCRVNGKPSLTTFNRIGLKMADTNKTTGFRPPLQKFQ